MLACVVCLCLFECLTFVWKHANEAIWREEEDLLQREGSAMDE